MSVEELEHYSKDQLIEELLNRQTFVGVVIFHRGDAKAGQLDPAETAITKSPSLSREGVECLLQTGSSLVAALFTEAATAPAESVAALPLHSVRPPLRLDQGGAVRVGTSRISLDLLIEQYENGMTPEDMVRAYDTLALGDVYAAIAYYLNHRDEVLTYLSRREDQAQSLRSKIEAERPRASREDLLARSSAREKVNAPASK